MINIEPNKMYIMVNGDNAGPFEEVIVYTNKKYEGIYYTKDGKMISNYNDDYDIHHESNEDEE